ncbi:MAG: hypothetical protein ACM37W_11905 [Actinomycetota bacterium]
MVRATACPATFEDWKLQKQLATMGRIGCKIANPYIRLAPKPAIADGVISDSGVAAQLTSA